MNWSLHRNNLIGGSITWKICKSIGWLMCTCEAWIEELATWSNFLHRKEQDPSRILWMATSTMIRTRHCGSGWRIRLMLAAAARIGKYVIWSNMRGLFTPLSGGRQLGVEKMRTPHTTWSQVLDREACDGHRRLRTEGTITSRGILWLDGQAPSLCACHFRPSPSPVLQHTNKLSMVQAKCSTPQLYRAAAGGPTWELHTVSFRRPGTVIRVARQSGMNSLSLCTRQKIFLSFARLLLHKRRAK